MMGEKEGGGDGVFHVCMYMINKRQEEEAKGRGAEPMIPTDSIYPRVLLTRHFLFFCFYGEIFDLFTNEINHQMPLAVCQSEL